ncbi:hypothetical protein NQ315_008649 [Exocentrus adspersus]|uniref:Uncharacterized protein n=1 Tax=Exocentrus adspersus TaxID=1586481 RepID=A0AAV8W7K6_9CUCU|nr:hypothetical protein NQ315_008649 [Exocentrus adspersus]
MGNAMLSQQRGQSSQSGYKSNTNYTPVKEFQFMEPFEEVSTNGLCLNNIYLPEEVVADILSYIPLDNVLNLTLVCKKWCNIIKSENFWRDVYNRKRYPHKAKKLPWYVFYSYFTTNNFDNLIKNGNGEEQYKHWKILKNFGDEFKIEDPPAGANPLPAGVPEFHGHTSCFATSFYECSKIQEISLVNKRLLRYIMYKFGPHIYASEWVAGRFDCGCLYKMVLKGYKDNYDVLAQLNPYIEDVDEITSPDFMLATTMEVEQWQGRKWEKVELLVDQYSPDVLVLVFGHEGHDTQFWKGHYGSKMAGAVVRFVFDSIQPLEQDQGATSGQVFDSIEIDSRVGNAMLSQQQGQLSQSGYKSNTNYTPVKEFQFMEPFEEVSTNGLCLNNIYLPEEVVADILSYIPLDNVLNLTLICKKWCNIIKSENFWRDVYNRKRYPHKAKKLPWYVFYSYFTTNNFDNLIKNGNGEEQYKHWKILMNFGHGSKIEDPPAGVDPLPAGVPEFHGHTSCFANSFEDCSKIQEISLANKRLLRYIMYKFGPHIYASEWVAAKFDCGCLYKMVFKGYKNNYDVLAQVNPYFEDVDGFIRPDFKLATTMEMEQWQGRKWEKVELLVDQYSPDVYVLVFRHEGHETQVWKGDYGSKMAGAVVRFVFDSIQPLEQGQSATSGQV